MLPVLSPSSHAFVYLHSHSPSISLHPPPVCPLPLVFFLHPVLLRSPLPSTLTASCPIKAPPKKLDRSDELTAVSPSTLTWIGQHTNLWEWLSSDSPMKPFWYLWKWLFHMEGHIWCDCLFINWNIPQLKLLKVAHILSGNSPHRLTPLTLDTALFCHVSVNPCISFHFSLTLAPVANLKSYPTFPPLFSPIFSILLPSKLSLSLSLCLSTLLSFPCPSLLTSWWNWLAGLRLYQWLNNSTPLSTVQGNSRSRCSWTDSPLQIPLSFSQNCLKV